MFRRGVPRSSSLILALANLSELILPLLRAVILARLLVPAQFGLAISVTLVASTIEMITDLGIVQLALRQTGTEKLATLHSIAVLRGIGLSLVIAAGGPLFALMFNAPGTGWIYTVVGLASTIRSFGHLENNIRMREYHYVPVALTIMGAQITWTIVSVVSAVILRDYRAMVIGVVSQAVAQTVISHWCSSTRYRWGWDRNLVMEAMRFGRPLTFNGVVLALANVGDRMLVASRFGLEQLAQYTALSTAAFTPRSLISKFGTSLFLPQVINAADDQAKRCLADIWTVTLSFMAALYAFTFIAAGQFAVRVAFGKHYVIDQALIDLAAVLITVRYMKDIPTMPALAAGRTSLVFLNTALATAGIGLAALLLAFESNLYLLLAALIVGEGLGLAWMLKRLRDVTPATNVVLWTSYLFPIVAASLVSVVTLASPSQDLLRWTLCILGVAADLGIKVILLRRAGIGLSDVVRTLFPRRTATLDQEREASLTEIAS